MEALKNKWKNVLEKCKSMHYRRGTWPGSPSDLQHQQLSKSKSWPLDRAAAHLGTPQGCFVVYVGPEKRRFVVSVERSGHPMFRSLLDDAETEYGHINSSHGPLLLPCDVDLFCNLLAHMDGDWTVEIHPSHHPSLALP